MRAALAVLAGPLALALGCGGDGGGGGDEATPCDVFTRADCVAGARMKGDVDELAGPRYAGRGVGAEGNALAVELVAERFAALGLAEPPGGRVQPFSFERWEPSAPPSLSVDALPLALGPDYEVLYGAGSGSAAAPLVFVGYGMTVPPFDPASWPDCAAPPSGYDDYAGVETAGAVVMLLRGPPAGDLAFAFCPPPPELPCGNCTTLSRKLQLAAARGAAGALVVPSDRQPPEATPFLTAFGEPLPALHVGRAAAQAAVPDLADRAAGIDATLEPASIETARIVALSVSGGVVAVEAQNVVGVVPGTDLASEVVVVGAHLDHMGKLPFRTDYFAGADDNASGTAAMLEVARAVAASPTRPRRTILFAAWNAEESGLIGSCTYVNGAPAYPLADTVAAFSIDMVGAGEPGLELWGAVERPWMADAAAAGAAAMALPWAPIARPELLASDHACFLEAGVPAFLASTPELLEHPYYHTIQDVPATVPAATLEAAARTFWASVRGLATGEVTPPAPAAAVERRIPRATARGR